KFTLYLKKRRLTEETLQTIQQLDPQAELPDELPKLFAADLNAAHRAETRRLVLFFDTHEAFWGNERHLPEGEYFLRDEWLRRLLRELELESGIVVAVAGRDIPRWAQADRASIPEEYLDLHLVGNLSQADAGEYLRRAGIDDTELQKALIRYTRVQEGEVHPLYLSLAADTVLAAQRRGTPLTGKDFAQLPKAGDMERALVNRFLKYVTADIREGIIALSAARSFDEVVFRTLGQALNFRSHRADFRQIIGFSFVEPFSGVEPPRYRLHDLLRELLPRLYPEPVQEAHRTLEAYYRQRTEEAADTPARVEAIYHQWQLQPEEAVNEWEGAFEAWLTHARYRDCLSLVEIARACAPADAFDRGRLLQSRGDLYSTLSRYREARQSYEQAVAAYEQWLQTHPDATAAHNNKGNALTKLGDLLTGLSEHEAARTAYEQAIQSYAEALRRAPDYINAHNNKGIALQALGDLLAGLSDHQAARTAYEQAIDSFTEALRRAPDDIYAHNNKGNALAKLG
ncbi:MAG: hypothetical protein D6681_22485, partial [Calditrichaeota bacterium]